MATRQNTTLLGISLMAVLNLGLLLLLLFSTRSIVYSAPAAAPSRPYTSFTPTYAPGTPTPTDIWPAFLLRTPFAYTTPFPPPAHTSLDGTYAKLDPSEPQWWSCRRCADYRPVGGIWKLSLDRGVFRVYYAVTGWRSLGSYTVNGDQLYLFNDPYCPWDVGKYTWRLEDGQLLLKEIEDGCSMHLRAENLTLQPWLSCQPPSIFAAISDHWPKPPGCEP